MRFYLLNLSASLLFVLCGACGLRWPEWAAVLVMIHNLFCAFAIEMRKHWAGIYFFFFPILRSLCFAHLLIFFETYFDGNIKRERKQRENLSTTFRIRNTCYRLIESVYIHDGATVISHRPERCTNNHGVLIEELHFRQSWINGFTIVARTALHLRL